MQKKKPHELKETDIIIYIQAAMGVKIYKILSIDRVWMQIKNQFNAYPKVSKAIDWNGLPPSARARSKTLYRDEYITINDEYAALCELNKLNVDNNENVARQNLQNMIQSVKRELYPDGWIEDYAEYKAKRDGAR
jgi:hypothetical protein